MAKSFVDRVLMFMGIQEEPVGTVEPAPAPERERVRVRQEQEAPAESRNRPENLVTQDRPAEIRADNQAMRVAVFHPRVFDDVQAIARALKARRPVVVTFDSCERDVAQRVIDFVSGATYTLDGYMRRLGDDTFLFTPSHISIDEAEELGEQIQQVRETRAARRRRR